MNATLKAFGYPDTCVQDYTNWAVLLRPKQATLGALVLVEKSEATSYGDVSNEAMVEQKQVVADIEANLKVAFEAEKFNYLMLMMADPNVHFHVIPRYRTERTFAGITFLDTGWPKLPDMTYSHNLESQVFSDLTQLLREGWLRL